MQQRANPNFLANDRFSQAVADGHPDGRTAPTVEALDKTTRDSMLAFTRRITLPIMSGIAITGDITMAAAIKAVQAKFAGWAKSGAAPSPVADPMR